MANTPNHNWDLPTVGADADTWGGLINDAFDDVDALTSGAQNTMLGRVAASSGPYTQLNATQITTIPNAVVGDSGSGGTKGMVPAPAAGDAALAKVLRADGTWGTEIKAKGTFTGINGNTVVARNISLVRNSAGQYVATLSPVLADANYQVQITCRDSFGDKVACLGSTKSTSQFNFVVNQLGASASDPLEIYITVLG